MAAAAINITLLFCSNLPRNKMRWARKMLLLMCFFCFRAAPTQQSSLRLRFELHNQVLLLNYIFLLTSPPTEREIGCCKLLLTDVRKLGSSAVAGIGSTVCQIRELLGKNMLKFSQNKSLNGFK